MLVITAGIVQIIGYAGYKKNKWKYSVYYYAFSMCAQFFLLLGLIPTRFPESTILQRIGAAFIVSLGTLAILHFIKKDLDRRKVDQNGE
jgi:hypothetical protein